jgi:hypothetical protein
VCVSYRYLYVRAALGCAVWVMGALPWKFHHSECSPAAAVAGRFARLVTFGTPGSFTVARSPRCYAGVTWRVMTAPAGGSYAGRAAGTDGGIHVDSKWGTAESLRAIIWLPDDPEWERYAGWCHAYCKTAHRDIVAIIDARAGGRYIDAMKMFLNGEADVIVTARRDHLPADRLPRVEVVAEERRHVTAVERNQHHRLHEPRQARPEFLRRQG